MYYKQIESLRPPAPVSAQLERLEAAHRRPLLYIESRGEQEHHLDDALRAPFCDEESFGGCAPRVLNEARCVCVCGLPCNARGCAANKGLRVPGSVPRRR